MFPTKSSGRRGDPGELWNCSIRRLNSLLVLPASPTSSFLRSAVTFDPGTVLLFCRCLRFGAASGVTPPTCSPRSAFGLAPGETLAIQSCDLRAER